MERKLLIVSSVSTVLGVLIGTRLTARSMALPSGTPCGTCGRVSEVEPCATDADGRPLFHGTAPGWELRLVDRLTGAISGL